MSGFLCSMVGATFTVAAVAQVLRAKKGITAVGNAQVDTAQSQFGGASAYFDGTDDYLVANGDFSQAGDFTIECWFRAGRVSGVQNFMTIGNENTGRVTFYIDGSTLKYDTYGAGGLPKFSATGTISINTWYHIAAVRSGGTITIYRDGTSVGTASSSGIVGNSTNAYFGAISDSNSDYQGHLDEIRYSNTARYTANFTPSTTPFVNDANTLLLIHANGTDGSTFFEDDNGVRASRSLIAIGNAQVDTAQSKFGGSALLCDGTGDYVRSIAGSQFDFGTSSFTIEYFIRFNAINTLYVPIALRPSTSIFNGEWWCEITAAENKMYWGFKNQAGTQYYVNLALAGTAFATGQWYHIALVNNAGTAQMYVNGTATGTTTSLSGSFGNSSSDLWVGAGASAYSLNGWLDEVRISNIARYTANFTAPTEPFVNDSNTLLLVHADGTDASTVVRDDNGAVANRQPKYITAVGNAQVDTAQSKFGGASAQFDGTGDALNISADSTFNFGTSDYTVECWIRSSSLAATRIIADLGQYTQNSRPVFYVSTDGKINIYTAATGAVSSAGSTITTNTWYHVALVRSSGTTTIYVDGVSKASTATSYNMSTTAYLNVGAENVTTNSWNGWIDEFRVSNTARYTTTFTPSTTPFVNDANTLLLIHANGTDASTVFTDDTANRTQIGIIANGNAQISTAQSKFGGASALFDGNADYLETNSNLPALSFGTGDFTFEGWFRFANTNADMALYTGSTSNGDLDIRRVDDNTVRIGRVNTAWDLISGASGITSNTWHHIAIVRQSTTLTIYVDGASKGSTSNSINYTVASQIRIGSFGSGGGLSYNGYMDEMRVSNIARYTAAFTPSTTPFQNDANTLLLLHMDGTNASTVFFDDNGIAPYTP